MSGPGEVHQGITVLHHFPNQTEVSAWHSMETPIIRYGNTTTLSTQQVARRIHLHALWDEVKIVYCGTQPPRWPGWYHVGTHDESTHDRFPILLDEIGTRRWELAFDSWIQDNSRETAWPSYYDYNVQYCISDWNSKANGYLTSLKQFWVY